MLQNNLCLLYQPPKLTGWEEKSHQSLAKCLDSALPSIFTASQKPVDPASQLEGSMFHRQGFLSAAENTLPPVLKSVLTRTLH